MSTLIDIAALLLAYVSLSVGCSALLRFLSALPRRRLDESMLSEARDREPVEG